MTELSRESQAKIAAGREQALAAQAWDAMQSEVSEAVAARKTLPAVLAKMDVLQDEIKAARSITVAAPVPPAKPRKSQVELSPWRQLALTCGAQMNKHRMGSTAGLTAFLDKALPSGSQYDRVRVKAQVPVANSTSSGWAAELVRSEAASLWEDVQHMSIFGQLVARVGLLGFQGAASVTVPRRTATGGLTPAWVAEAASIPVLADSFGSSTITRHKLAAITTATNELLAAASPSLLPLLEGFIKRDLSEAVDGDLLDPANVGVVATKPAAITNGATNTASAGATLANIVTDWKQLRTWARDYADPVVIMSSDNRMGLEMVQGEAETFPLRSEVQGGALFGLPILSSPFAPADVVIVLDASAFMTFADPIEVLTSSAATVVMVDAEAPEPQMGDAGDGTVSGANSVNISDAAGVTGGPGEVRSMYQTNSTALRLISPMSWALAAPNCAYLSAVQW